MGYTLSARLTPLLCSDIKKREVLYCGSLWAAAAAAVAATAPASVFSSGTSYLSGRVHEAWRRKQEAKKRTKSQDSEKQSE